MLYRHDCTSMRRLPRADQACPLTEAPPDILLALMRSLVGGTEEASVPSGETVRADITAHLEAFISTCKLVRKLFESNASHVMRPYLDAIHGDSRDATDAAIRLVATSGRLYALCSGPETEFPICCRRRYGKSFQHHGQWCLDELPELPHIWQWRIVMAESRLVAAVDDLTARAKCELREQVVASLI